MRLFEKHPNGSIIDMDGEPERVVGILMDWRKYQDAISKPRGPIGFVVPTIKEEGTAVAVPREKTDE